MFHFTAANTTPEQNRRQLIADAAEWGEDSLREEDYPNWRTVFRMLMELKAPEPLVVILDEFQYFGSDAASLSHVASELNAVWEQRRPMRALVLVLSGSSIGMLESLNTGAAPLYGRFAWHEGRVSVLTRMLPIPRTYRTIMLAPTARGSTDPLYSLASAKSLTPPAP